MNPEDSVSNGAIKPDSTIETSRSCFCLPFHAFGNYCYRKLVYKPLAKKYFKELTYSSIPVFIAAAFSSFVMSLIRYISEETKSDHIDSECIQTFFYSITAYSIGYYLTIHYKQALSMKEKSYWVEWSESHEYSEIIFGFFAENSAFAWREFVNSFVLKILFLRYGWGQAAGGWFLMLFVFCGIAVGNGCLVKWLVLNKNLKDLLLEFDADSFALPLAFSFTVLWALGFELIGAEYVDKSGYLYEWKDDDSEVESSGVNGYYYLYLLLVSSIVALILVLEDRVCFKCVGNIENAIESYNPRVSQAETDVVAEVYRQEHVSSPSSSSAIDSSVMHGLELNKETKEQLESKVIFSEWIELWHNFLGCLVGVAFYTAIVDEFLTYGHGNSAALVIIAFVVALLISWRVPSCIASSVERQIQTRQKFLQQREENQQQSDASCWSYLSEWYLHLKMHRRGATIISVRLIIGWTWETAIAEFLNWIADASAADTGLIVAIDFGVVLLVLLVSWIVHYFLKHWKIDEERVIGTEATGGEVANPIQNNNQPSSLSLRSPVQTQSMLRQ